MNATSSFKQSTTKPSENRGVYAPPIVRTLRVGGASRSLAGSNNSLENARVSLATAEAEQFFVLERLLTAK